MAFLGKMILVLVLCLVIAGCSFHFKGTDIDVEGEAGREKANRTYNLDNVVVLDTLVIEPWQTEKK